MSKYYTPDLTEFHIGFEYEIQQLDEQGYYRNEWVEFTFENGEYARHDSRVKYLDKNDIESLGFEYYMENKNQKLHIFYKDNVFLAYDEANNKIKTFTKDPSLNKEYMMTNADPYLINGIIIKNKSEFKKFLKQINLL